MIERAAVPSAALRGANSILAYIPIALGGGFIGDVWNLIHVRSVVPNSQGGVWQEPCFYHAIAPDEPEFTSV